MIAIVKRAVTLIISFLLAVGLVAIISNYCCILISNTNSLPQHYFLHCHKSSPKLNDYSVTWSNWYGDRVIKKIVGIAGDSVWYNQKGELMVNDQLIGVPQKIASDGRALNPIQPQTIPEGLVFLAAEHPKSFDSRYQEFALVPTTKLEGLVIPLL